MQKPSKINNRISGQIILAFAAIVAIAIHLILPAGNLRDVPLQIVIIIGSVPILWEIVRKLIKLDLGADILAAIALVTAAILGEYLAAVLIILMLAGGQALEGYAMRKASSVLAALAERMPTIAHRKTG